MKKNSKTFPVFEEGETPSRVTLNRINREILKRGGLLHFRVEQNASGWMAQCQEIKGIITGGENANPSQEEIVFNLRDAIRVAFNAPTKMSMVGLPIGLTMTVGVAA